MDVAVHRGVKMKIDSLVEDCQVAARNCEMSPAIVIVNQFHGPYLKISMKSLKRMRKRKSGCGIFWARCSRHNVCIMCSRSSEVCSASWILLSSPTLTDVSKWPSRPNGQE